MTLTTRKLGKFLNKKAHTYLGIQLRGTQQAVGDLDEGTPLNSIY
jgi:hypothetical protein